MNLAHTTSGTGETAGVYSLLNLSAREHPKASSAGDTEENLIPCYATVGGLVDKKVTTVSVLELYQVLHVADSNFCFTEGEASCCH